jgi:hypothetical protein
MEVLAGADFFTVEVLTWRGLVTYDVLFFIYVRSRRVSVGGITRHPDRCWMAQVAQRDDARHRISEPLSLRAATIATRSSAAGSGKHCSRGVKCTPIPARSPNLNAHAERWARSIKEECLSKLILFGENLLRRVVSDFVEHYHQERRHQGKGNLLLFPVSAPGTPAPQGAIRCRERPRRLTQALQPRRKSILALRGPRYIIGGGCEVPRATPTQNLRMLALAAESTGPQ